MITRRKLITRAAAFIAAPAIIRVITLMPVRAEKPWVIEYTWQDDVSWLRGITPEEIEGLRNCYTGLRLHYYRPEDLGHGWKEWHEAMVAEQAQSPSPVS